MRLKVLNVGNVYYKVNLKLSCALQFGGLAYCKQF
jgi:hypothetical protein